MRRFDKKKNISKVNLLAEQRYLVSKGLITEDINEMDYSRDIVLKDFNFLNKPEFNAL